jgi:hypothetical protein
MPHSHPYRRPSPAGRSFDDISTTARFADVDSASPSRPPSRSSLPSIAPHLISHFSDWSSSADSNFSRSRSTFSPHLDVPPASPSWLKTLPAVGARYQPLLTRTGRLETLRKEKSAPSLLDFAARAGGSAPTRFAPSSATRNVGVGPGGELRQSNAPARSKSATLGGGTDVKTPNEEDGSKTSATLRVPPTTQSRSGGRRRMVSVGVQTGGGVDDLEPVKELDNDRSDSLLPSTPTRVAEQVTALIPVVVVNIFPPPHTSSLSSVRAAAFITPKTFPSHASSLALRRRPSCNFRHTSPSLRTSGDDGDNKDGHTFGDVKVDKEDRKKKGRSMSPRRRGSVR